MARRPHIDGQQDFLPLLDGGSATPAGMAPPPAPPSAPAGTGGGFVFVRSWRARRYRLTVRPDGSAVVTIPPRGTEAEGRRFAGRHGVWLERMRSRQLARPRCADTWAPGTHVWWRGSPAGIVRDGTPQRPSVRLGADVFRVPSWEGDLRPALEAQFARRARVELPARAWELAARTGAEVKRVVIRSQRTRWGSCSAGGTISLNWRLMQAPEHVRDYIILHELMHLREMNHSGRFWALVDKACPLWREAEQWLDTNGGLLGL